MIASKCPTCGYFLGNLSHNFELKKDLICKNPDYNEKKKGDEIQKLILSLNLRRYCCKKEFLTYKDLVYEILPRSNSKK